MFCSSSAVGVVQCAVLQLFSGDAVQLPVLDNSVDTFSKNLTAQMPYSLTCCSYHVASSTSSSQCKLPLALMLCDKPNQPAHVDKSAARKALHQTQEMLD